MTQSSSNGGESRLGADEGNASSTLLGAGMTWAGEPVQRVGFERPGVSALISPRRGGKIVSIRGPSGREWLEQPIQPVPPPSGGGIDFLHAEMCGWDECIPTVEPCLLEDGLYLPDHGEVWNKPWQPVGSLLAVELPHARGAFSRAAEASADGSLTLTYQVRARERPLAALWAAHPQFIVDTDTRVEAPDGGALWWELTKNGPKILSSAVARRSLSMSSLGRGDSRKLFLDPHARAGSATLQLADGVGLQLTWDASKLPFLGVWMSNCDLTRSPIIAIEPSTGWYDSLARSLRLGFSDIVSPWSSRSWQITLRELGDQSVKDIRTGDSECWTTGCSPP